MVKMIQLFRMRPTYKFYEAIKEDYIDVPDRLSFVTDKVAGHAVTRSGMLACSELACKSFE